MNALIVEVQTEESEYPALISPLVYITSFGPHIVTQIPGPNQPFTPSDPCGTRSWFFFVCPFLSQIPYGKSKTAASFPGVLFASDFPETTTLLTESWACTRMSKVAVTQLIDRVLLLEDTLKRHNIQIPRAPQDCQEYLVRYPDASKARSVTQQSSSPEAGVPDPPPTLDTDIRTEEEFNREKTLLDAIDGSPTADPDGDAELDLLAKRMGSLRVAEDGQLRYYGATSNMHILRTPATHPPATSQARFGKYDAGELLTRFGVGLYVPRELEEHLIKLYMAWENPFIHVVDADSFMQARQQALTTGSSNSLSRCYNEILVNAM